MNGEINILEMALAILLIKSEDPDSKELCNSYLAAIESKYEVVKKQFDEKGEDYKKRFDTVLTSLAKKEEDLTNERKLVGGPKGGGGGGAGHLMPQKQMLMMTRSPMAQFPN